jgi:gluconate 2-dehydrogenase gamma chain
MKPEYIFVKTLTLFAICKQRPRSRRFYNTPADAACGLPGKARYSLHKRCQIRIGREDDMAEYAIPLRGFLKGADGAAVTAVGGRRGPARARIGAAGTATTRSAGGGAYLTLTAAEAAFLSAAYDTFIPADELSPSGTECGLVTFTDRQLAGGWGGGARLYRSGSFVQGKLAQGCQRPLTPREYFAAGITAANAWTRKIYGRDFDRLTPAERDAVLKAMETGKAEFADLYAKRFFEALYQSAMEGFFADPIHRTSAAARAGSPQTLTC